MRGKRWKSTFENNSPMQSAVNSRAETTYLPLPILSARGEILPNVVVHLRFIRIPTPAAVLINRYVLERVELETPEPFVALPCPPVVHLAVPQMEQIIICDDTAPPCPAKDHRNWIPPAATPAPLS
jgi:hypothetical protein